MGYITYGNYDYKLKKLKFNDILKGTGVGLQVQVEQIQLNAYINSNV